MHALPPGIHSDASQMKLKGGKHRPLARQVKLRSRQTDARCKIWHVSQPPDRLHPWQIKYRCPGRFGGETKVTIYLSTDELRTMFGIGEEGELSKELHVPGQFWRIGGFLSIPGRGTGEVGDLNCCLEVTPEIQGAVRDLIRLIEALS